MPAIKRSCRPARGTGFSLAELLTATAILAILATAVAPSFTAVAARQRVRFAADQLAASISLGRSAALAHMSEVWLMPLPGQADLDAGWQVRAVRPDVPLAEVGLSHACLRISLRQTGRGSQALRFTPVGYSRSEQGGFQAATFAVSCGDVQRQVRLGAQGRIRICEPGRDAECDPIAPGVPP